MSGSNEGVRWHRLVATLIDVIILGFVSLLIMLVTGIVESAEAWVMPQPFIRLPLLVVGTYVLLNCFHSVTAGQTLGKKIMGIRVQSLEGGSLLPIWKLMLRTYALPGLAIAAALLINANVALILYGISLAFVFGKPQRCGHDYLVGSVVVRTA